jgi:hypothetical protein
MRSSGTLRLCTLCTLLLLLVGTLASPSVMFASDSAQLYGRTTDPSGAAIPAATVAARNVQTGFVASTVTDANGEYRFGLLPIGHYVITVTAPNFQTAISAEVVLQVDQRVLLDVPLKIGQTSATVQVQGAEAAAINTADATISTVIDAKRVLDLPLNGRNLLQLTVLAPGVRNASSAGFSHPFQPQGNIAVSASGSGGNSVNYSLDGGDNNYNYNLTANVNPNPDFVQEFSFQTNNFDPEYGRRGGGIVNVVTKSGTTDFHGTLFEYVRNQVFNAYNYFSTKPDGLKRNQFGGTLGGPIRIPHVYDGTAKLFFFFGYQGTRLRQVPNTLTATVFTPAEETGDFSQAVNASGSPLVVKDPTTGQPFPGNVIPQSRFDPSAVELMKYLPTSSNPDGLIFYQQPTQQNDDQFIGRMDANLGRNDRGFFRVFMDDYLAPSRGVPGNALTALWPPISQAAKNIILGETHTFSPHLVTENSFTFNRQNGGSPYNTDAPTNSDLGINITDVGGDKALIVHAGADFNLALDGKVDLISENFNYRNTTILDLDKQELRFGADIARLHFDIPRSTYQGDGAFTFGNAYTGQYLTDLLLGYVSSFQQSQGYAQADRETDWGFWIADNIRLLPRFTLNLGLRYQPFLPYYDAFNRQNMRFIPGEQSVTYPTLPTGVVVYGDPGVPRALTESSYNRFSPRVGIALDPRGDGKTSLRAGWGIFYDAFPLDYTGQFGQVPPYTVSLAYSNLGALSFSDPYHGKDPFAGNALPFPPPHNYVFPGPSNVAGTEPHFREPVIEAWNVTLEQQVINPNMLLSISYQASHGTHLQTENATNYGAYIPGNSTESNLQKRRPYPSFSNIAIMQSHSYSDYSSMVVTFQRRFSQGVSVLASYLWSKSINQAAQDGGNTQQGAFNNSYTNPADPSFDRGVSDVNVPNRFVASYLWQLPTLQSAKLPVKLLLGGWSQNGIVTVQSGTPFSVLSGQDNSFSALGLDRADLHGNPHAPRASGKTKLTEYFNTAAFSPNAIGTFGNSPRNLLYGPGTVEFDESLFKNFPLTESRYFQFRAEFFNIFNHPNFSNPQNNLSSSQFGTITSAASPRIIQLALRLAF